MLETIKNWLLDGVVNPVVVSLVVGAVMWVLHSLLKDKSTLVDKFLAQAVNFAYDVLSKTAPATPSKIDDQVVVFLKALREYFASHGITPSAETEEKALAMFRAKLNK